VGTNPGSIARPSPLSRALRFCFPHNRIRSATSNRSISGLILPFTYVPAYTLPVYASQDVLPHHHARLGTRRLARLYRGSHLRLLNSMRFPRRNPQSGRIEARFGLRMMPTFPRSPLSFRTAGFPQYGWKAGLSSGAFPVRHPRLSLLPAYPGHHSVCTRSSCITWSLR
jgi:hypothetical protein